MSLSYCPYDVVVVVFIDDLPLPRLTMYLFLIPF